MCGLQEAERKIPMNYASRYRNTALEQQSYLPFKVRRIQGTDCLPADVQPDKQVRLLSLGCEWASSMPCAYIRRSSRYVILGCR